MERCRAQEKGNFNTYCAPAPQPAMLPVPMSGDPQLGLRLSLKIQLWPQNGAFSVASMFWLQNWACAYL